MADIAKCNGNNCKAKETCYRYKAPNGYWQSYSDFYNLKKDNQGKCEYYWKYTEKQALR